VPRLRYLAQENRGPAAARNAGIAAAEGQWLVFLGDDTIPAADFLQQHLAYHERHNADGQLAVVGHTRWDRRLRITPFLRFAGEEGPQFGYAHMRPGEPLPYKRFYTSNLSFRRELLERLPYPFDEDFTAAMWEDTDLGYRLHRRGMVLHYHPEAIAEHDHPTTLANAYQRFVRIGAVSRQMLAKHPELVGELHSTATLKWISRLSLGSSLAAAVVDVVDRRMHLPLPKAVYWALLAAAYARGAAGGPPGTKGATRPVNAAVGSAEPAAGR
jgi:GT2 family glycosyltransferase